MCGCTGCMLYSVGRRERKMLGAMNLLSSNRFLYRKAQVDTAAWSASCICKVRNSPCGGFALYLWTPTDTDMLFGFMVGFEMKRRHSVGNDGCGLPSFFHHPVDIYHHGVYPVFRHKFHDCRRCCMHVMFSSGNLIAYMCSSRGWKNGANDVQRPKTSATWIRLRRCAMKHEGLLLRFGVHFPPILSRMLAFSERPTLCWSSVKSLNRWNDSQTKQSGFFW